MAQTTLPCKEIKVEGRFREDFGDIETFAQSIKDRGGLYHPIVVSPKKRLLAGERRLKAIRDVLKWKDIPVTYSDAEALDVEYEENERRKDYTMSEHFNIEKAIDDREKEAAKEYEKAEKVRLRSAKSTDETTNGEAVEPREILTRKQRTEKAGFTNDRQYYAVAAVMSKGTKGVQQAMDSGEITLNAAEKLVMTADSKKTQTRILREGRESKGKKGGGVRAAVNEFIKKKKPIDEVVLGRLRSAVMDVQSITNRFDSFTEMINSKGWEHVSRETCIQFVICLYDQFSEWNEEFKDHEKV